MSNRSDQKPDMAQPLQVDAQGNVTIEGVKICRMDPQGQILYFLDRDKRRIAQRGSDQVPVPIAALTQLSKK